MTHLTLLLAFAAAQIAIGLYIGRRVTGTSDFFVAGRRLNGPMLFATLLAANIGAGSTLGAAGYGYRDGLSAWWWVGSAAMGSVVLGLWVGPAIRRIAAAHDLRTLGDFLEWRYDWRVRAIASGLLWIGMLAILGGQLLAISTTLVAVAGWPKWIGCVAGGVVVTIYFTAGGMRASVWVNIVQLSVKIVAFLVALPFAFAAIGGVGGLVQATDGGSYWSLWRGGSSGWFYLAMLGPSFFVSPGLLQKVYGARDDRAVRAGVLANAAALFVFAFMPVLLGMIARGLHPGLGSGDRELALPLLLVHDLPLLVGSLGLAGLVSAEVSAADAVLFALATSLSQDLYKRFLRPSATDTELLRVARYASVVCGALGIGIALFAPTVGDALKFFYTLLSVSLFVPVLAGLFLRRSGVAEVLAAMLGGVALTAATQLGFAHHLPAEITPAMVGIAASVVAWALLALVRPSAHSR
jgi:SSS family solute:Na+ symporter